MRLKLTYDVHDPTIANSLDFGANRLFVARSLIPREYEVYFRESAHYMSAHTSTAIEGNPLDEEKAMLVLVEGPDPDEPSHVEKVNLDEAYELMSQLASDRTTQIDEGIVRAANSIVLKGLPTSQARNRGKYRSGPTLILDPVTRAVRYRPPPSAWVAELMKNFVIDVTAWRSEFPGPIAAALAHFGLISIHPFEDGNGRTARLVADMLLNLTGSSADGMISVSQVIHQRLADYYRILRETQGEDFVEHLDVTEFAKFHTAALGEAAVVLEEKAARFRRLRDGLVLDMKDDLNERQVTALLFMNDIGRISSSRYARLTECSQPTALSDLNALIEQGLVQKQGSGKNTRYRLEPSFAEGLRTT